MKISFYLGIILFISGIIVLVFDYSDFSKTGSQILIFIGILTMMVSAKFTKK